MGATIEPSTKRDKLEMLEIKKWLKIFQCTLIGFILYPLDFTATMVVLAYRLIISLVYKIKYKNKFILASSPDSTFAVEKHANLIAINSFLFLKGPVNINSLQEKFESKLINYRNDAGHQPYKKLSWRLINKFGFFTWEDTAERFDITEHVKLCPGLSDRVYMEQEVLEITEAFADDLFSQDKPQWELLIVPKVKLEEGGDLHYAMIFRVYHAYMDGISQLQMLQHGLLDDPNVKYTVDPRRPPLRSPTVLESIAHYILALLLGPYTIHRTMKMQSQNVFQEMVENSGPKYFGCTTMPMSMDRVKHIRKEMNCTTTAIFNTVITGALRRAAERKGLIPVPDEVDFGFTIAVLPYPDEGLQNRFTISRKTSPMGEEDPVKRLAKLDGTMKSLAAHEVTILYWTGKIMGYFPVFVIEKVFENLHSSGFVITNLPGFAEKLRIDGCGIEEMYGCPPIKNGVGFGVGVSSYLGKVRSCWMVENSKIISSREDMTALLAGFEKEFLHLEAMASGRLNNN